jgi:hypothetical protein
MTLEKRLRKEKKRLDRIAVRDPRSKEQMAARMRWERLRNIVWRRYDQKNMPQL